MAEIKIKLYPQDPALLIAATTGNQQLLEDLLEESDVNCTNRDGVTPLFAASSNGHYNIVRLLLESWAQVDAADTKGRTALIAASFNGHFNCVQLLLDKGADPLATDEQGVTALHAAVLRGSTDIVNALLDEEPELRDFPTKEGRTPLHYAAAKDQYDCVDCLVLKNANLNARDVYGKTALHIACENDSDNRYFHCFYSFVFIS